MRILLLRLGIVVFLLYVTRLIFYFANAEAFPKLSIYDFLIAVWFDLITVGLFFLPYYVLYLLPFRQNNNKLFRTFLKTLFHLTNALLLAANLLDVEYFKYTSKRSTFDLFTMVGTGNDVNQLLGSFFLDFWHQLVILGLLIVTAEYLHRRTEPLRRSKPFEIGTIKQRIFAFIITTPILFIIGRGGFGLKPTGIIEAATYSKPENTPFILPTAFTMVKTISQEGLELKDYYDNNSELDDHFDPIRTSIPQYILPDSTNVMIILLESFGSEFVGAYHNGDGYTPFLDSLIDQSLFFEYGFANGKKSIEAVPAIVASLPTLMDNPYISSPYGMNSINTIPSILKEKGYTSVFYHGATNGSMSFDGFAEICGYDQYVGRTEYNNESHSDMTWGILDEHFNPWTAKELTKVEEPFFGTLFTLSSHHPYFIPKKWRYKVRSGPQKICASISYADHALRLFFEEAKKQPWYNRTVFIILADHTPGTTTPLYNQRTHLYRIPILFYHPGGLIKPEKSKRTFQQLDILPTILDLLNIKTEYYSFGNSYYQDTIGEAITYISGSYHYFKNRHMTVFNNDKAQFLYDFDSQQTPQTDSSSFYKKEIEQNEKRIKAIIQHYNRDLMLNETTADEKKD